MAKKFLSLIFCSLTCISLCFALVACGEDEDSSNNSDNGSTHEHNYTAVVTDPTCTEQGYTTYTCSCKSSYVSDYTEVLGHAPAEAVRENEKAATCTAEGSYDEVIYCSVCEVEISRETKTTEKLAHTYVDGKCSACEAEDPDYVPDPEADSILTIEQAIALGASKKHNNYTTGKYYVSGVITEVYNTQYGNMKIKDEAGNILTVYGTYSADGNVRYDSLDVKPVAGDTVTIYGIVGQYSGAPQIKNGWLVAHTPAAPIDPETCEHSFVDGKCTNCGTEDPDYIAPETPALDGVKPVVGTAYKFGMLQAMAEKTVYITGVMSGYYMDTTEDIDAALDVYVEETEGGYYITCTIDGAKKYINMVVSGTHVNAVFEDAPSIVYTYDETLKTFKGVVNDADYVFGTRNDKNYTTVGTSAVSYNPFYCVFVEFDGEGGGSATPDEPVEDCEHNYVDGVCSICGDVEVSPISANREKADGTLVKVSGVVAGITYANGKVPNGIILVDETSSIYVYDRTIAGAVSVGNTVTVRGTVGHWILEEEQTNAAKFGYKGSCQIENATLIDNDGKTTDFDKSWIEETTVKEILDTPVTENITTKLYKVTALVKEVPGSGFTNFYFFDIDGSTSTYAYTQCNGSDFEWLREYDGKFCTVYITALNAKSTSSDCIFRFLPVAVYDEGYTFNASDAPAFAIDYHALKQFKKEYTADPALSLIGSVSSELLGLDNITLSYTSSDESVIKFTQQADGSYVMNCLAYGTAIVTISATYGEHSHTETIEITFKGTIEVPSITPEEAIASANDEVVTVKGIVGPSFVHSNRRGFYLIGTDSVIAISFANVTDMKDVSIGNTVIITGTRATIKDTQICIDNAALVENLYGASEIPDGAIVSDKSLAEALSTADTTSIFRVSGTVNFVVAQYYTNCSFGGSTLYSSNAASQYSFLEDYNGQDVTALLSIVNWNGKDFKFTLLGIETEDGTIYNEYSFGFAK